LIAFHLDGFRRFVPPLGIWLQRGFRRALVHRDGPRNSLLGTQTIFQPSSQVQSGWAQGSLDKAKNPPQDTRDFILIDGGCGVPIIVTTDPGLAEDSKMLSIRLEGVCGSLTGSRRVADLVEVLQGLPTDSAHRASGSTYSTLRTITLSIVPRDASDVLTDNPFLSGFLQLANAWIKGLSARLELVVPGHVLPQRWFMWACETAREPFGGADI
jgi:hypothetical protein